MLGKKGSWVVYVSIALIVLLVTVLFFYFALYNPNYDSFYDNQIMGGELVNPVSGLSYAEAVEQFDENFVYYLLYSVKAYNLHKAPLSSDSPKIEVYAGDVVYNAEIVSGKIYVSQGEIAKKDIIIYTTKEEAVKMLQDSSYIQSSFSEGKSSAEKIEGQSILFGKGYLSLYTELTGKGITGNVARIYFE